MVHHIQPMRSAHNKRSITQRYYSEASRRAALAAHVPTREVGGRERTQRSATPTS